MSKPDTSNTNAFKVLAKELDEITTISEQYQGIDEMELVSHEEFGTVNG